MEKWWEQAIFYHIYPLGYLDAPQENSFDRAVRNRIQEVLKDINHIKALGCTAIYFGPVFESGSHGYDTIDHRAIDRRIGDLPSFRSVVDQLHKEHLRVVLDGVFNHVGREFPFFRDVREKKQDSAYTQWFKGINFYEDNRFGDGFSYEGWEGHDALVTLDLQNEEVRQYLFDAVTWMIEALQIDGLRLDVAYLLDRDFLDALSSHCRKLRPDFWLMGEMIHGDYRELVRPGRLDSATNYECYKGLYSSHNDRNYFEIAWSFNRQYGPEGLYRGTLLYNFADNHDVDRIAGILKDRRHLPLVYVLLFTMPGIPSVYYGSEWYAEGRRSEGSDRELRPPVGLIPRDDDTLVKHISNLSLLRRLHIALRLGDYEQIHVSSQQFVFRRQYGESRVIVALNASEDSADLSFAVEGVFLEPFDWKLLTE